MNQFGAKPSQPAESEALFPGFPTLDAARLIRVVRKRLWLAGLVAAGFVALAFLYVALAPRIYESSAVIYVDPKNDGAAFNGMAGVKQASWETLDALKSMAEGIRNGTVVLRVVENLGLRDDPEFLKPRDEPYTDSEVVEIVGKRVNAELRRGMRIIDISVRDKSPERAQKMAAAFLKEFQSLLLEQNSASSAKSGAALEKQAESQRQRVLVAEERLQEFRLANAEIPLDEKKDYVGSKLADLDRMLSDAGNEVLIRKAQYDQYKAIQEDDIGAVLEIGDIGKQDHIQKLLLARNQKRAEFVKIKSQYKPSHATYQSYELDLQGYEEQVNLVAAGVGESIENAYKRAVTHEEQLKLTVQEQKKKLIEVDGIRKEYRTLKGAVDAAYSTYENLLDRVNDTDVTQGIDETVIRVFSEPLVPAKPVSPKKKITIAAAGVFGIMCGMALVVGLGLLDRTLNSRKQVESTLGLAVLAEIPTVFDGRMDLSDAVFITKEPTSIVSEGFRSLRTSLSAHTPRSVMVTSPSPGEGKSFCAANLAVLQANMGYRTLLVDADFCKPRMTELFVDPLRASKKKSGEVATQNVCQETVVKDLFLLSCGRYTSDTGEPMNGEIFGRMLHEAYASFDCVIIDTSPLNVVSDGLTYSRHADAVVLVVKAGETEAESARRAMRELQRMRSNLVGCVLNASQEHNLAQEAYVQQATRSLPSKTPQLPPMGASS